MHNSIYEMCRKGSESEVKLLKKTEKCEGKFLEKDWKVACKAVEVYRKVGVQAIKTEKQKKKKKCQGICTLKSPDDLQIFYYYFSNSASSNCWQKSGRQKHSFLLIYLQLKQYPSCYMTRDIFITNDNWIV